MKLTNRGGKRTGAGRPKKQELKKKSLTIRLEPELIDYLNQFDNKSEFIQKALNFYIDSVSPEPDIIKFYEIEN